MTVYESKDSRLRNPTDAERFDRSHEALEAAGIHVRRVMCSSVDDIDPDGEARSIVSEIARLIKPFVLSPCASAWACIKSFWPFGILTRILSYALSSYLFMLS